MIELNYKRVNCNRIRVHKMQNWLIWKEPERFHFRVQMQQLKVCGPKCDKTKPKSGGWWGKL